MEKQSSPVEMAKAVESLIKAGVPRHEIAHKLMLSAGTISRYLQILKLHPLILDLVDKGQITFNIGFMLSKYPYSYQLKQYTRYVKNTQNKSDQTS